MILLLEWLAFARDLTWIATGVVVLLYLFKLIRPSHDIDRIAYLAMAVATVGILAANLLGGFGARAFVPWALFALVPAGLFWSLELEFATRLMGLGTGLLLGGAALLMTRCGLIPISDPVWAGLARAGALAGAGLACAATVVATIRGFAIISPVVSNRRSGRFFGMSAAASAEIVYRHMAWALPCELFAFAAGAVAFAEHQLSPWPLVALLLGTTLSAGYTFWCRPSQLEPGFKPMLVMASGVSALAALRLLGIC